MRFGALRMSSGAGFGFRNAQRRLRTKRWDKFGRHLHNLNAKCLAKNAETMGASKLKREFSNTLKLE